MANVTIKAADPTIAGAIAEGAAVVELREVREELGRVKAREGVRAEAANRRWERTKRRLARKYSTEPVGRLHGAILGVWALLWLSVVEWIRYFERWNREA